MSKDPLLEAAVKMRDRAYAPYSGYRVGAAIVDAEGRMWTACNVENVSFGLCVCAERAAVARMVAEGGTAVTEVVVATSDGGMPCGMCVQTLLEFAAEPSQVKVRTVDESGIQRAFRLGELMPHAFASDALRTKGPRDRS